MNISSKFYKIPNRSEGKGGFMKLKLVLVLLVRFAMVTRTSRNELKGTIQG
jgi:hypothetical protein